ncbi:MAG: hypothetical protein IJK89_01245 [Clostridia bacterium]|nr:hypothetical protein [Clostridia bacterium]
MELTSTLPCIILPGMGQSQLEYHNGDGTAKTVWPLKLDRKAAAKRIRGPYLKTVLTRKDRGFTDAIHDVFYDVLEPIAVLPDGGMKHDIRPVTRAYPLSGFTEGEKRFTYRLAPVRELAKAVGEENIYLFAYNFFADLYESAEQLDDFIQTVKRQRNADQVCLLPVSMGGALFTAYLDAYGAKNDVAKVMFIEAALDGSVLMRDILAMNVDKYNGYSVLEFATTKGASDAMRKLLSLVPWEVRFGVLYRSLDAAFETALGRSPAFWATTPKEDYPALRDARLADGQCAPLREKIDRVMAAQFRLRELIAQRQAAGAEFYAVSGYGKRIMALSASGNVSTDGVLAAYSTSLGAMTAPRGEKLDPSVLTPQSRLSPDGEIDASTGFLKDTTWFFKGQAHNDTAFNDAIQTLVKRCLTDPDFTDVFSDPELPQFTEASDSRKRP